MKRLVRIIGEYISPTPGVDPLPILPQDMIHSILYLLDIGSASAFGRTCCAARDVVALIWAKSGGGPSPFKGDRDRCGTLATVFKQVWAARRLHTVIAWRFTTHHDQWGDCEKLTVWMSHETSVRYDEHPESSFGWRTWSKVKGQVVCASTLKRLEAKARGEIPD